MRKIGVWLLVSLGTVVHGPGEDRPGQNKLSFHYDSQRSGWNSEEKILTPRSVAGPAFGPLWESPPFDTSADRAPRLFASPLYVDAVTISNADYEGGFSVVFAVSSTGFVYAVNGFQKGDVPPGAILWRARLTDQPCLGGMMGNLSTPVIDLEHQHLYVTSCDQQRQWQAHALDIRDGRQIPGWPIGMTHVQINQPGINTNGPAQFPQRLGRFQRGALTLSHDGKRLYVAFGSMAHERGWMVVIDTDLKRIASAFSSTANPDEGVGGMWASGGPAVDADGNVFMSTGSSTSGQVFPESAHNWAQSILKWTDSRSEGLILSGTYTPFNYCRAAARDIDLGSSGPVLIDLDPALTSTPHVLALGGGKQGNAYLLDRDNMPGSLERRQPCSDDSQTDASLLNPQPQPQFGQRGPINVFGPYSEEHGMVDQGKSRSTLAHFQHEDGTHYLFLTGSSKKEIDPSVSVPPGLVRVKVVTSPGQPAYLEVDDFEKTLTFQNPGSPIVTSDGGKDAIVWVLDENAPRSADLWSEKDAPRPVLYALDAMTFKLLWRSTAGDLNTSGKYNEPAVVRGTVFVGTDRIQAFGLR